MKHGVVTTTVSFASHCAGPRLPITVAVFTVVVVIGIGPHVNFMTFIPGEVTLLPGIVLFVATTPPGFLSSLTLTVTGVALLLVTLYVYVTKSPAAGIEQFCCSVPPAAVALMHSSTSLSPCLLPEIPARRQSLTRPLALLLSAWPSP